MNPIALYAQIFGKSVPCILIPDFVYYFFIKWEETKDVVESLKYAAQMTLFDDSMLIR